MPGFDIDTLATESPLNVAVAVAVVIGLSGSPTDTVGRLLKYPPPSLIVISDTAPFVIVDVISAFATSGAPIVTTVFAL